MAGKNRTMEALVRELECLTVERDQAIELLNEIDRERTDVQELSASVWSRERPRSPELAKLRPHLPGVSAVLDEALWLASVFARLSIDGAHAPGEPIDVDGRKLQPTYPAGSVEAVTFAKKLAHLFGVDAQGPLTQEEVALLTKEMTDNA